MVSSNTIVATSTGAGGAITVIRMSGNDAVDLANSVFRAKSKISLLEAKANSALFGTIVDSNGEIIDEVVLTLFRAPRSYTGEDIVEISSHASPYIEQKIIELLITNGASPAAPGQFTQRAYLNGKLDLVQAEAVADIIASSSEASHRLAMNQMRGGYSRQFSQLRDELLHLTTLLELELDFSEEDVEFADRDQLSLLISKVIAKIESLIGSYRSGNAIKNGVPTAIVGFPNVGKSTLLNALVKYDRAIVSHIAGTTRDTIEESINIGGVTFRFIDTAGIRQTDDVVESIGIERTFENISKATLVIAVFDAQFSDDEISSQLSQIVIEEWQSMVVVINKCDLVDSSRIDAISSLITTTLPDCYIFQCSAQNYEGVATLESNLSTMYAPSIGNESVIITNVRHIELLTLALESAKRSFSALKNSLPTDLVATDTRQTITHLGSIMGEINTDDVLKNVFSNFCIGK